MAKTKLLAKCDTGKKSKKMKKEKKVEKAMTPERVDKLATAMNNRIKRIGTLEKKKLPKVKRVPAPGVFQRPDANVAKSVVRKSIDIPNVNLLSEIMKSFGDPGTVLGHTASGKPVKVHGNYHGRFNAEDHRDAADVHDDVARKFEAAGSRWGSDKVTPAARKVFEKHAKHHRIMANKHRKHAMESDRENGSKVMSDSPHAAVEEKSPLFSDAKKSLATVVRKAVTSSIEDMKAERADLCDAHGALATGLAGMPNTADLSKSTCSCDKPFSKSAVALRASDKLLSDAQAIAAAKELGIELGAAWVEDILATAEDDED